MSAPSRAGQVVRDARDRGPYVTTCPSCGRDFEVGAKHLVRQRARCRACVRRANGWRCIVCGSSDPEHPSPCPTARYLSLTEVADRLGVTRGALATYRLPTPDAHIGRVRGWLPSTIEHWQATRPGRGNAWPD